MPYRKMLLNGFLSLGLFVHIALAQPAAAGAGNATSIRKKAPGPDFGTTTATYINIPSFAFQTAGGVGLVSSDIGHFRWIANGESTILVAPVIGLPSGIVIDTMTVNDCIAADGDLVFELHRGDWNQNFGGSYQPIAVFHTAAGCGLDGVAGINYQYDSNLGAPLFIFVGWDALQFDGSDRFNDVAIGFHRIVSPAPATPTFGDVPTSDPRFQFVEALAAAGITAGCGRGDYCPNLPATRGQLAVLLAKALGLHWPN